jgi:quinol monooxygenase YgiN
MTDHAVLLVHRTKPGRREDVRDVWMEHMAPAVRGNDDHLAYYYCFDLADDDVICAFQVYRSAAAAGAFLEQETYRQYLAAVEPLLTGPPEFHALAPIWTKGPEAIAPTA